MATHYGRIGDTSMNNSEHHDMDANNYQADINDLENIEPNHQAGLRDLTWKTEIMAKHWGQWQWPYGCQKSLGMQT